jgi:hypothetical protein
MNITKRIAMWSGPRNISTALMRSFGSRQDTCVVDEPLYAFFLHETGMDHPGREAILASQPQSWRRVARDLTDPIDSGESIFYQKHMAHHLLPQVERAWMRSLTHAFLIREPRAMLNSYSQKRESAVLTDLGFPQQVALYKWLGEQGFSAPPVIDSRQVLEDPRGALTALCEALGIDFDESMLSWEAGKHDSDGIWADHWYDAVVRSTGFQAYTPKPIDLSPELEALAVSAQPYYEFLYERRL